MIKITSRFSYGLVAVLSMIALMVPQVFAFHSWQTPAGDPYHWARQDTEFTLQLIDSMSNQWEASLVEAVGDWSSSTQLRLVASATKAKGCQGKDGKVQACNDTYGDNGWLGIASVWAYSDGHIVKGVVQMNDTYFDLPKYSTQAWRNLVVCQEIGHTLGLGHQDEGFENTNLDTCMDYTDSPDSNQHPNNHDYEEITSLYSSHLDSFDSYAVASTGGKGKGGKGKPQGVGQEIDPKNPASWGLAVKEDAHGNPSLYMRNLGNGQTVFTHVTWVDGFAHEE